MVRAKLGIYYTFKVVSDVGESLLVHCLKWEEFADVPMETYKIKPDDHSPMGGCSCPAWRNDCKHMKCVREALADGKINELFRWKWTEKGGWEQISDISTIEDMPEIG